MSKKELLTDLYTLLKKHKAYMRTEEDWISIIHEDTGEQIQSFFYMIDTVDISFSLHDMEMEDEETPTPKNTLLGETVLTDAEIIAIGNHASAIEAGENGYILPIAFARAIEQAVLNSPEVQAWKRDSERLDWLESSVDSHGFCHAGYGDYIYYAHQEEGYPSVREVIDAAVGQQK